MSTQYVINPPSVPEFLYKSYSNVWLDLIEWAKQERKARLKYLSEHGYYKEYKRFLENDSPIKILAELTGYRKLCFFLTQNEGLWNRFTGRQRVFIRRAYELRDILKR